MPELTDLFLPRLTGDAQTISSFFFFFSFLNCKLHKVKIKNYAYNNSWNEDTFPIKKVTGLTTRTFNKCFVWAGQSASASPLWKCRKFSCTLLRLRSGQIMINVLKTLTVMDDAAPIQHISPWGALICLHSPTKGKKKSHLSYCLKWKFGPTVTIYICH